MAYSGGARTRTSPRVEWPTIALATTIYGGWIAAVAFHAQIPLPLLIAIGGWLVAWHNSLQHETIHGHPTPWAWLNTAIGAPPLGLLCPYLIYRDSHLEHHASPDLTHPRADPESRYLDPDARLGAVEILAARLQSTLLGRMVLGPLFDAVRFIADQIDDLRADKPGVRRAWALHVVVVAVLLVGLQGAFHLSPAKYLACFVYPGAALSLIRSFAEHRAHAVASQRVAIVEKAPLLGLLFLNNNLHAAHHSRPDIAWWRLPAFYRSQREALLADNGGLLYRGYGDVFVRYLFKPHDQLRYPDAAVAAGRPLVRS